MENHSNPRKINFELLAQRANDTRAPQCVAIVKRLDASASVLDAHRRYQILALPRRQLALADSADRAEHAAAHQHYLAAGRAFRMGPPRHCIQLPLTSTPSVRPADRRHRGL